MRGRVDSRGEGPVDERFRMRAGGTMRCKGLDLVILSDFPIVTFQCFPAVVGRRVGSMGLLVSPVAMSASPSPREKRL